MVFVCEVQGRHDKYRREAFQNLITVTETSIIPIPRLLSDYLGSNYYYEDTNEKRKACRQIIMQFTAEVLHQHTLAMEFFWNNFVQKKREGLQPSQEEIDALKTQWLNFKKKRQESPRYVFELEMEFAFEPYDSSTKISDRSHVLRGCIYAENVDNVAKLLSDISFPTLWFELELAVAIKNKRIIELINKYEKASEYCVMLACKNGSLQFLKRFQVDKRDAVSTLITALDKKPDHALLPVESVLWLLTYGRFSCNSNYLRLGTAPQEYICQITVNLYNLNPLIRVCKKAGRSVESVLYLPNEVKKQLIETMPLDLANIIVAYLWKWS